MPEQEVKRLNVAMIKLKALKRLEDIRIYNFSQLKEKPRESMIQEYRKQAGETEDEQFIQLDSFEGLVNHL